MIELKQIESKEELKQFYKVVGEIYKGNTYMRFTEDELIKMIVEKKSVFFKHAKIINYIIKKDSEIVGRFSLIKDDNMSDYVQVSFFECKLNINEIGKLIIKEAKKLFPKCKKVVVGLNAHLNYSAGFLASRFNEVPIFGLPYSQPYYAGYFEFLNKKTMYSYRFANQGFYDLLKKWNIDCDGVTIRTMDRKYFERDINIYTKLNNDCFTEHPFWSNRTKEEDLELLKQFSILLEDEHLIIAEKGGKPIGFLFWYPDFNQLTNYGLNITHLLKYKLTNKIDTIRIAEIAVLPKYRHNGVTSMLIKEVAKFANEKGYAHTEAGFIFEENKVSIITTLNSVEKATGKKIEPYRKYVMFEGEL